MNRHRSVRLTCPVCQCDAISFLELSQPSFLCCAMRTASSKPGSVLQCSFMPISSSVNDATALLRSSRQSRLLSAHGDIRNYQSKQRGIPVIALVGYGIDQKLRQRSRQWKRLLFCQSFRSFSDFEPRCGSRRTAAWSSTISAGVRFCETW